MRLDAQEEHHRKDAVLAQDRRDPLVRLDGVTQRRFRFIGSVERVVQDHLPFEPGLGEEAAAVVQAVEHEAHVEAVQDGRRAQADGDFQVADARADHELGELAGDERRADVAGPPDLRAPSDDSLPDLGALGVGGCAGDELGVGEPEPARAPLAIVLRDVVYDPRGRAIPDGLAFQVGVETEGAVVRAPALALYPDAIVRVGGVLREDLRDIREVHGQVVETGVALSGAGDGLAVLACDEPLAVEWFAFDHFQHGLFALAQDADGALRQLLDELLGEGAEGPAADHDLRAGADLPDQPGVRQVGPDAGVVLVERFQAGERRREFLERVGRVVEVERVLQRGVPFMRREDLDVAPGEADQVGANVHRGLAHGPGALARGNLRQVEDALADVGVALVDVVGEIGAADRIDRLAGQKDVEDALHLTATWTATMPPLRLWYSTFWKPTSRSRRASPF